MVECLVSSTRDLDDAAMNYRPDRSIWSPAQVVEHMVLANRPYLKTIEAGMERAQKGTGDHQIHYSFFGKLLIKAVGPDGNAPAPKVLHPSPRPIWRDVFTEWQQQQTQLLSLLDQGAGIDFSRASVRNPFIRMIRMNVADCLEIMTAHTERHVRQVQARLPRNAGAP